MYIGMVLLMCGCWFRHRLGVNYEQLPINQAVNAKVANYQRDGAQRIHNQVSYLLLLTGITTAMQCCYCIALLCVCVCVCDIHCCYSYDTTTTVAVTDLC
jgi:Catalase